MALFPEKEPKLPISEVPEAPEIPKYIEEGGVRTTPSQPRDTTISGNGQASTSPPNLEEKTVEVPADQTTLTSWSKGPVSSSLTWLGAFWLRIIKKAFHFGWKIVKGES